MKLEDIIESLNFTAPITWTTDGGIFTINDKQFIVNVRPANRNEEQTFVPFFNTLPKVGNVDFSAINSDNSTTQDLTGLSGNTAMKVFSVVAQGVAEQVKQHGYNILLCVAKRTASPTNYQKRVNAYETIVERAARTAGLVSTTIVNNPSETVYAIYRYDLMDGINKVKQYLADYYKDNQ